jgi:hypothetical protein
MAFPSKGFFVTLSVVLFLGLALMVFVAYEEAHTIVVQGYLIQDMWKHIVAGCPVEH